MKLLLGRAGNFMKITGHSRSIDFQTNNIQNKLNQPQKRRFLRPIRYSAKLKHAHCQHDREPSRRKPYHHPFHQVIETFSRVTRECGCKVSNEADGRKCGFIWGVSPPCLHDPLVTSRCIFWISQNAPNVGGGSLCRIWPFSAFAP